MVLHVMDSAEPLMEMRDAIDEESMDDDYEDVENTNYSQQKKNTLLTLSLS